MILGELSDYVALLLRGRINLCTSSVRLSVCLSVRPPVSSGLINQEGKARV